MILFEHFEHALDTGEVSERIPEGERCTFCNSNVTVWSREPLQSLELGIIQFHLQHLNTGEKVLA